MDFESYVRGHSRRLMRFATVLADDPATAEDVVQEVLLRAHARWSRIGSLAQPHAYVRRMIVHETVSWRRKWGRIEAHPDVDLDRTSPDRLAQSDTRDELTEAVAALPSRQRAVVVLRYFEDLDDAEIAAVLGCRPGTVRGYVHRALKTLRIDVTASDTDTTLYTALTGRTSR